MLKKMLKKIQSSERGGLTNVSGDELWLVPSYLTSRSHVSKFRTSPNLGLLNTYFLSKKYQAVSLSNLSPQHSLVGASAIKIVTNTYGSGDR